MRRKQVTTYDLPVGGFLGIAHYVAVDLDSINIKYDQSNKNWRAAMNVNATKDQLKNAPEFKYGGQWTASKS